MKILDIQKNEIGKVLIFGLMLGIRTAGATIGWAAVQTIILKRLGIGSLAYSFVFFALISMAGAGLYLFFADAVPRRKLLKIFCIATGINLIIAGIFIPNHKEEVGISISLIIACFLILTGNGIGYSATGIQIWTLINDTFRPNQGARLYPIIATAPLIGSIIGGLVLQFLSDKLDMKTLIIIWGLSTLMVLPLLSLLYKYYGDEIACKTTYLSLKNRISFRTNLKEGYRFSIKSPLVHVLAAICILFWTVASLKEFQYGVIMNKTFLTEAALNKYYGNFTIVLHGTVLFLQILLTGRIIKFTGVGRGFCILPVTIFAGLVMVLISFSFYSGVIMRFTWDLVAMTVQGTIFQLAFNGIEGPFRGRVRGLLEGFINPFGGIIGGLLIIFINKYVYPSNLSMGADNKIIITLMGLLFSFLWIYVSIQAKERYKKAILQNFNSTDRRTFLDSIEMLAELDREVALEKVKELINLEDSEVKLALSNLISKWGYTLSDLCELYNNETLQIKCQGGKYG